MNASKMPQPSQRTTLPNHKTSVKGIENFLIAVIFVVVVAAVILVVVFVFCIVIIVIFAVIVVVGVGVVVVGVVVVGVVAAAVISSSTSTTTYGARFDIFILAYNFWCTPRTHFETNFIPASYKSLTITKKDMNRQIYTLHLPSRCSTTYKERLLAIYLLFQQQVQTFEVHVLLVMVLCA